MHPSIGAHPIVMHAKLSLLKTSNYLIRAPLPLISSSAHHPHVSHHQSSSTDASLMYVGKFFPERVTKLFLSLRCHQSIIMLQWTLRASSWHWSLLV